MRIQDNTHDDDSVNMTPLIDMVFLLLIFFLVATTIAQDERPKNINLPITGTPKAISAPPDELIINIEKDGKMRVAGLIMEEQQLKAALVEAKEADPPRNVLIRADQESLHKYFAKVAGMCHDVGIANLNIGYVFEPPNK